MSRGIFITLEGGDGTGKSTQARLLRDKLVSLGLKVDLTREPGGTEQAEKIRSLLLQRDSGSFDPLTEAMLMFAARREHLVNRIWPALARGEWVISDRFADSTRAFQGYGMGLDADAIENLYTLVAGDFQPDLTIIFDVDPAVGLQRSGKRSVTTTNKAEATEDRYESMGLAFQERLRQGYLDIATKHSSRCVLVDASGDVEYVHSYVMDIIARVLKPASSGGRHHG